MSHSERIEGIGKNKIEKLFYTCVSEFGLTIMYEPTGILAPYSVKDKNGERKKRKTTPDYLVCNVELGLSTYVEVTKGAGRSPSKIAQKRVIEAANIENYVQLTGNHIQKLYDADLVLRRVLLFQYLGWATPSMSGAVSSITTTNF